MFDLIVVYHTDVYWRSLLSHNIDPRLSQHLGFSLPGLEKPVKQLNFRKANWSNYKYLTNQLARNLPSPDSTNANQAYLDICNIISKAVQQ